MIGINLGIIRPSISVATPFLLDTYTGAAAAYSLRKLRTAYSGSAIRVRRSSDNTEQDIGFTSAGALDESSITTFVGSNSGYVTKWYDQSGNARDAAQATSASQPRIVSSGNVDKSSNKPTIYFGGSTYFQVTDYDYVNYASLSVFSMNMPNSSSGGHLINHGDYNASNFSFNIAYYTGIRGYASSNGTITASTFNILTTNNSFSTSSPHILSYIFLGSNSASNKQLFYYNSNSWATTLNGTYNANISSIYNSSKSIDIGVENRGGFGNHYFGRISELVLYNSDQSSNRTGIESNINSYYSIY